MGPFSQVLYVSVDDTIIFFERLMSSSLKLSLILSGITFTSIGSSTSFAQILRMMFFLASTSAREVPTVSLGSASSSMILNLRPSASQPLSKRSIDKRPVSLLITCLKLNRAFLSVNLSLQESRSIFFALSASLIALLRISSLSDMSGMKSFDDSGNW